MPPAARAQTPTSSDVEQPSRSRRRGWLAIGLTGFIGLALLIASATIVGRALYAPDERDVTASPSLPRRIGPPAVITRSARRSPIGAASVVFSSDQWTIDGINSDTAVTGARGDAYRRISASFGSVAGIDAILSPDGTRLAVRDTIIDLVSGKDMPLSAGEADYRSPQAWSPDGRYLATVSYTFSDSAPPDWYTGEWYDSVKRVDLSIVDTVTGKETRIARLDTSVIYDGWIAAFSPDGSRLAYQSGNEIVVTDLAGAAHTSFHVADGVRIAGKGAWARDGHSLALVAEQHCDCGGRYPARWTIAIVDASTGVPAGPSYPVEGVVALRMLGWSPAGRPVVVSYDPLSPGDMAPVAVIVDFRTHTDKSGVDDTSKYADVLFNVDTARVVELAETGTPRALLTPTYGGAESLDVADGVIAGGLGRAGRPPRLTFMLVFGIGVCTALAGLVAGAVTFAVVLLHRRRVRRRRRAALATAA